MKQQTMNTKAEESLSVPGAPAIDGLTFRQFQGDQDYPSILAVNTGSKIADGLDHDLHSLETITFTYAATPNHNPYKDTLIAEVNGNMVAFYRAVMDRELDGTRIYWHVGFVLPEWRGRGLEKAMLGWIESHAREIEAGQEGDAVAFSETVVHSNAGMEALLKADGYEPVRYQFHMRTPDLEHISDVPVPEGLEIRPAKPEHLRAIWEANAEAFRDHWGATETGESDFDRFVDDPQNQPELWVVAWDGDQVAGSILNFINYEYNKRTGSKLGYTENISVRRPWRRKGLARALLARSMRLHKELGMTQTALGVDTQNPSGALQLYQSIGYQVVATETTYRKRL